LGFKAELCCTSAAAAIAAAASCRTNWKLVEVNKDTATGHFTLK
jgi:hypothetical protein